MGRNEQEQELLARLREMYPPGTELEPGCVVDGVRDGRPHTVPVDGIWQDGGLYFGGDPKTVHIRNLRADPRAVAHTESGASPVIVEGTADWYVPSQDEAGRLAVATREKYGYPMSPAAYTSGTWRLVPEVVLAWNVLFEDATRFRFAPASS